MAVDWAMAMPQNNLGEQVNQAFQQGQQNYIQNTARNALSTLVQTPNDPQALAALAKVSPDTAMKFRQQQAEMVKQQLGEHAASVKAAGEIAQRIKAANPTMPDEQVYQLMRSAAIQQGIPGAELAPAQFDQNYYNGILYGADMLKNPNAVEDPSIIREFDEATQRKLIPPGTTYEQYVAMRNPSAQQPIILPQNYSVVSGGAAGGSAAAPPPLRYNSTTGQWEPEGGATGSPSHTFPQ